MSDTPIADAIEGQITTEPPAPESTETALGLRITPEEIERILAPHTLTPVQWIRVLLEAQEIPEADPDEMALGILAQIFLATTPAEVMGVLNLERARDLCGNKPGGRSPVYTFHHARPMKSRFDEGAPCYAIFTATVPESGEIVRFTTGAKSVQAIAAKMLYEGWVPFKFALEIRAEPTARGFHPLNMVFGI